MHLFLSLLHYGPTEFKTEDMPQLLARTMYLTPSVPNLCILIQYLSVQCPTWKSVALPDYTNQFFSSLPVLTLVCSNHKVAASYLLLLHTAETNLLRLGTFHPCKHLQILQRSLALVTLR